MSENKYKDEPIIGIESGILDDLRQLWFPAEFRIAAPALPTDVLETAEVEAQAVADVRPQERPDPQSDLLAQNRLLTELITCLWYLKTKHFKRKWDDHETGDDDPRIRRTLGRLNKSIEALKDRGIEVHDPTNQRYPRGGEGMMRPIQFLPTAGLTFEMVSETVVPIIYREDRLIQRGEVFVAVPKQEVAVTVASARTATTNGSNETMPPESEIHPQSWSGETKGDDAEADLPKPDTGNGSRGEPYQDGAAGVKPCANNLSANREFPESPVSTAKRDSIPVLEPEKDSRDAETAGKSTHKCN
ncbi:MAG: hypothetical protein ACLQPD_19055 [Desulfomonilaceae bacterium]